MFSNLSDIIKIPAALLTGMAASALLLTVAYEGVSLLLVGQVINGRVANAVDAATESTVSKFELKAAKSSLEEMERQRNATAQAFEEYRRRRDAEERLAKASEETREQERMAYEIRLSMANRRCTLDRYDLDFLLSQPDRSAE